MCWRKIWILEQRAFPCLCSKVQNLAAQDRLFSALVAVGCGAGVEGWASPSWIQADLRGETLSTVQSLHVNQISFPSSGLCNFLKVMERILSAYRLESSTGTQQPARPEDGCGPCCRVQIYHLSLLPTLLPSGIYLSSVFSLPTHIFYMPPIKLSVHLSI